jgi:hypothetical protein
MMLTKPYTSLFVQMIYVFITGLQLIFVPNLLLEIFGFEPTAEVWIRVLGLIVLTFAVLYFYINRYGSKEVVRATVYGRLLVGIGFVAFVVLGLTKPTIILFGGVDVATALWTWAELKK